MQEKLESYHQTDRQIHWLSQILAKVNRSFVPEEKDDSHTNLGFDFLEMRILSRWFMVDGKHFLLSLNLETFSFELFDEAQESQWSITLRGKSIMEIENNLIDAFELSHIVNADWRKPMHYEIPDYGFQKSPIDQPSKEAISIWTEFRYLANLSALNLIQHAQSQAEIRIWPHHFDTGIYFELPNSIGLGFGLAMQDDMVGEAYFYHSINLKGKTLDQKSLKVLNRGEWQIKENWKGAILKLSELIDLPLSEKLTTLNNFLKESYGQLIANLEEK